MTAPNAEGRTVSVMFEGLSRPVAFVGCGELLDLFGRIVKGWSARPAGADAGEPIVTIRADGDGYEIDGPLADPFHEESAVSAVCSFIIDLVHSHIDDNRGLICLHCGAVEIGGRLVVFPSVRRAGKSTLVSRLAASGVKIFTDDLLAIAPDDRGLALGVAPRLRLPLPETASPEFVRFVSEHAGPGDDRYQYLSLDDDLHARHGEGAPLGAVVTLERRDGSATELVPASTGHGLQHLIVQNLAREETAMGMIDRLHAIVETLPCYTLHYCDLDEAEALIRDTFSDWDAATSPDRTVPAAMRETRHDVQDRAPPAGLDAEARYAQAPGVGLRAVDGHLFLVDAGDRTVFHLNMTGAGIWNLLAEPTSADDAVAALSIAFPDVDDDAIERDVRGVMSDLLDAGLVRQTDG